MTSARDIATDLLRRLLAGERGQLPLHLAMLLEKSSRLDSGDEHYRQILPQELAGLRLSPEASDEIIAALCAAISLNPDQALIFAISFTGTDQASKTAAQMLTNPPRPLTMAEYQATLALLNCYLPYRLAGDSGFLPSPDLQRLVQLLKELRNIEESGTDRVERISVRQHAGELFESLTRFGISGN